MLLRGNWRQGITLSAVIVGFVLSHFVNTARADDERKRQIVNGILRILIDSQRDRRSEPAPPPPPPRNPNPRQPTPRVPDKVVKSRAALVNLANESNGLMSLLSKNVEKAPGIRTYMPDMLKFRARSHSLAQISQRATHPDQLLAASRELDRDWRVLAYRLQHTPGLTIDCTKCIGRMNEYGQQLCDSLGYKPQVDYASLSGASNTMMLRLQRILDDLELEYGRTPQGQRLIIDARRVAQYITVFNASVRAQDDYDSLVKEYKKFLGVWSPLESKLRSLRNRYVERSLERADETDAAIHELLW